MAKVFLKPVNSGIVIAALGGIVVKENMETTFSYGTSHKEQKTELTKYIKNDEARNFLKNADYKTTNLVVSKFGDDVPTKALFEYNASYSGFGSKKFTTLSPFLIPAVSVFIFQAFEISWFSLG
jgi:hypothetical protein